MRNLLMQLALLLLLVFTLITCEQNNAQTHGADGLPIAKDFTLKTLDGKKEVSLRDLKGKAVVLNFWATWCAPCREEMPLFERTWREVDQKDLVFIGVDVMDDSESALKFIKTLDLSYMNLFDPSGEIANKYGVIGLPVTLFINKEGNISHKKIGSFSGVQGEEELKNILKEIGE